MYYSVPPSDWFSIVEYAYTSIRNRSSTLRRRISSTFKENAELNIFLHIVLDPSVSHIIIDAYTLKKELSSVPSLINNKYLVVIVCHSLSFTK